MSLTDTERVLTELLRDIFLHPTEADITKTIQFLWDLLDEIPEAQTRYALILALLQKEAHNRKQQAILSMPLMEATRKNVHTEKILFLLKHKLQVLCALKPDFSYTCFKKGTESQFTCFCGCDGSFKQNKGSCGYYISQQGTVLAEKFFLLDVASSFEAEAWALIYTLQNLSSLQITGAKIYTDNQQVVQWLRHQESVALPFTPLFSTIKFAMESIINLEICNVPRELNARADKLARLARVFPTMQSQDLTKIG